MIKSTGDGLLATFDGPARAIRCVRAIERGVATLGLHARQRRRWHRRCHRRPSTSLAGSDEVVVSSTVKDLVAGSGIRFQDRGIHALKGVPEEWHVFTGPGDLTHNMVKWLTRFTR
jgi:class 3 adenylate cyclase